MKKESKDVQIITFLIFLMIVFTLTFVGWVVVGSVCLFLTALFISFYVNMNFLLKLTSPATSSGVVDPSNAVRVRWGFVPISFADNKQYENAMRDYFFLCINAFFPLLSVFIAFCIFFFVYFFFRDMGLSKFYLDGAAIFFSLFSIVINIVFIKVIKILYSIRNK